MNLSVSQQSFLGMKGFSSGLGSMDTARNRGLTLANTGRNMSLSGKPNQLNKQVTRNSRAPANPTQPTHVSNQVTQQKVSVPVLNDEDTTQNLKELLTQNELLIRYKKGDEIVSRMKKVFKTNKLQKCVKFRSDKKIKWSPQYFINGDLSNLKGFMSAELLRLNIIVQLQDWEESESDDFDDKSATDSDEDEFDDEEVKDEEDTSEAVVSTVNEEEDHEDTTVDDEEDATVDDDEDATVDDEEDTTVDDDEEDATVEDEEDEDDSGSE